MRKKVAHSVIQASVMAKYLVDSKARIDPSWYRLADEIVKGAPPEPHMEIPQLWNMRGNSRIKLKNGRLIDMVTGSLLGFEKVSSGSFGHVSGGQSKLQAIYGGVESLRGTQRPFLGAFEAPLRARSSSGLDWTVLSLLSDMHYRASRSFIST